jgi:hypothetical protein
MKFVISKHTDKQPLMMMFNVVGKACRKNKAKICIYWWAYIVINKQITKVGGECEKQDELSFKPN